MFGAVRSSTSKKSRWDAFPAISLARRLARFGKTGHELAQDWRRDSRDVAAAVRKSQKHELRVGAGGKLEHRFIAHRSSPMASDAGRDFDGVSALTVAHRGGWTGSTVKRAALPVALREPRGLAER